MIQETTKALDVVQKMLTAFGKGDMEALKQTLSENTIWVYHGTDGIPYNGTYQGKDGAVKFITNIMSNVDVLDFQIAKFVADQNTVVVLGSEKQKILHRAGIACGAGRQRQLSCDGNANQLGLTGSIRLSSEDKLCVLAMAIPVSINSADSLQSAGQVFYSLSRSSVS